MVLCGLRFDTAEKPSRAASGKAVQPLVVFHLTLAFAMLTVGRQNHRVARKASSLGCSVT